LGKGGVGTLYISGEKVGEGRIERTQPMIFSAEETADVGIDLASPVVEAIGSEAKSRFTGRIPKVTVEVHDFNAKAGAAVAAGQRVVARVRD
jgi:arylsulfatase